jgi:hypothetical protein
MRQFGIHESYRKRPPMRVQPHLDGEEEQFDMDLLVGGPTQKEVDETRGAIQTTLSTGTSAA